MDKKTEQQPKTNGKDTEKEPSEALLAKIKAQVEHYFGNVNMQRDKFLIEQTKLDEGWIPMTVMLKFRMLASLSKNVDVILKALETSDLMEISEDRKKIRRSPKHPLPGCYVKYTKDQEARTVLVKGFPTDIPFDKLLAFFESYNLPFEKIVTRKANYMFKGSVFVQFTTFDGANAFMKAESVKYGDTELIRKWAVDYSAEKKKYPHYF